MAYGAYGTILTRGAAETPIAELTKIGSPVLKVDTIDTTNHQSEGGFKEFIGGLIEAGSVPIEGNFISDDVGQMGLLDDLLGKTIQDFSIKFPNGAAWTFKALVEEFSTGEADVNGALTFKASLKVSGKPTLGASLAANLTDLVVTTGAFVPAFDGATKEYVVNIASTETSVTITPTCVTADSILVDGNVVASGVASSAIKLGAAGSIKKTTVVVKQANKTDNVYTLYLTRAADI